MTHHITTTERKRRLPSGTVLVRRLHGKTTAKVVGRTEEIWLHYREGDEDRGFARLDGGRLYPVEIASATDAMRYSGASEQQLSLPL